MSTPSILFSVWPKATTASFDEKDSNPTCAYEWFHLTCLELMSQPKSKNWYCGRRCSLPMKRRGWRRGFMGTTFSMTLRSLSKIFHTCYNPFFAIFRLLRVVRAREHKLFFERGWKALPEFAAGNFVSFRLREGLVFYT